MRPTALRVASLSSRRSNQLMELGATAQVRQHFQKHNSMRKKPQCKTISPLTAG